MMEGIYIRATRNTILLITGFLTLSITGFGQPVERSGADSLLRVLNKTRKETERISILIQLAQFQIFKPGERQIDFDSATTYLNEARRLNETAKSVSLAGQLLLTESILLKEKGQKGNARTKVEKAIKVLQPVSDKANLGKAYAELSGYYEYTDSGQLAERIRLMERSLSFFQQAGDAENSGASYHALGNLYQLKDDFPKALYYLGLALETYKSIRHTAVQGIYSLMGTIYTSQGDYKLALNYGLLALKNAEEVGDTSNQLCQINNAVGRTLVQLNELEKATSYFDKALSIAEKYNDINSVYDVSTNLATNWNSRGDSKKALTILKSIAGKYKKPEDPSIDHNLWLCYIVTYTSLKQYPSAQPYCDRILRALDNESMEQFERIDALSIVIYFYTESGQYDLAAKYLHRHDELSQQSTDVYERTSNQQLWFALDTAKQNYGSAVKHLLNYNRLKDSLFNETKARQLQQLEVEYETAKKEDSLKQQSQHISLLQQRNDLQRTNLKQANFIKNITIAGILFVVLVLALLYYQFRKNQRSNLIILQKNKELEDMLAEKEWWLKEVHHRVKNNLHTIICLLESQAMYLEKDALQAIEKSQHRIYAMSLIHQKLYQNEDVRSIDMSVYIEEIVGYLKDSFGALGIEFIIKVDPIQLNLQQAIPVALIINEGVTNSIKYAFDDEKDAQIRILMTETDNIVRLGIMDNGKGFEQKEETNSLGLQLIKGLSKELRGTIQIESVKGTQLTVEFKRDTVGDQIPILEEDKEET